jgi:hypothetical protein
VIQLNITIDNKSITDALITTGVWSFWLPQTFDSSDESAKRTIESIKNVRAIQ